MTFYYLCSGEYIEFETNRKRPNLQMLMLINNTVPSIDLMHFTTDIGLMMAKSLFLCSPHLYPNPKIEITPSPRVTRIHVTRFPLAC